MIVRARIKQHHFGDDVSTIFSSSCRVYVCDVRKLHDIPATRLELKCGRKMICNHNNHPQMDEQTWLAVGCRSISSHQNIRNKWLQVWAGQK